MPIAGKYDLLAGRGLPLVSSAAAVVATRFVYFCALGLKEVILGLKAIMRE
jgi:hypothetical protein